MLQIGALNEVVLSGLGIWNWPSVCGFLGEQCSVVWELELV